MRYRACPYARGSSAGWDPDRASNPAKPGHAQRHGAFDAAPAVPPHLVQMSKDREPECLPLAWPVVARVDLEVALVRLTASEVAGAGDPAVLEGLIRRIQKLEAALAGGAAAPAPPTPPPPPAPAPP